MRILDIKYLQESIVFQVLTANKLCNWISLYRSPSQPTDIFDQFGDNLELTLGEVGENWYTHDKMSYKETKTDTLTAQFR